MIINNLHIVHSIAIKINIIITEVEAVCKKLLQRFAAKATNCENLSMLPLTEEAEKSHSKQKFCYICRNNFNKNIGRFEIMIIIQENIAVLHILHIIQDIKTQTKLL